MAEIELVIKIPEKVINRILEYKEMPYTDLVIEAIYHGVQLPKGHGRLKDIDWIDDNCPNYRTEDGAWCYKWEDIDNAPTIIEADKTGSEE